VVKKGGWGGGGGVEESSETVPYPSLRGQTGSPHDCTAYPSLCGQVGSPHNWTYPSLCGQSGSPHNWPVSFFLWTVGESPQLDRILLSVDSRGVLTTRPYPSFCGQSVSPHNWTDELSKSQSQQPDRNRSSCRNVGSLRNTGAGLLHLPHCILFVVRNTNTNTGHSLSISHSESGPTPSKSVLQLRIRMPGGTDCSKTICRYEVVEMCVCIARSLLQPPT